MGRSPCCDKTKVIKGPWSLEEDNLLKDFITNFGNGGNWISLPKKVGLNRCGKSCRLRWLNYLRPDVKHGDFTEEEDVIIYTLYNTVGSRWSLIASKLSGRTDNDVKNYWNTKFRKKILSGKFKNAFVNNNMNNTFAIQSYHDVNIDYSRALISEMQEFNKYQFIHNKEKGYGVTRLEAGDESYSESRSLGSSTNSEVSSQYSRLLSSDVMSSGSEKEFWMDLFSESFDDVGVGSKLVDEKINEIASLLNVLVE